MDVFDFLYIGTGNGVISERTWSSVFVCSNILTGVLQVLWGVLKIARFMKFIPRAVMIGFANALAILIFSAQIQYIFGYRTYVSNCCPWGMGNF
jgi:MFS superfamily sulfate permease-like transporter